MSRQSERQGKSEAELEEKLKSEQVRLRATVARLRQLNELSGDLKGEVVALLRSVAESEPVWQEWREQGVTEVLRDKTKEHAARIEQQSKQSESLLSMIRRRSTDTLVTAPIDSKAAEGTSKLHWMPLSELTAYLSSKAETGGVSAGAFVQQMQCELKRSAHFGALDMSLRVLGASVMQVTLRNVIRVSVNLDSLLLRVDCCGATGSTLLATALTDHLCNVLACHHANLTSSGSPPEYLAHYLIFAMCWSVSLLHDLHSRKCDACRQLLCFHSDEFGCLPPLLRIPNHHSVAAYHVNCYAYF